MQRNYTVSESLAYGLGSGTGWALAIIVFAAIRERLRSSDIPDSFPLRKHVTEGRDVINDGGSMIAAPGGKLIAGPVTGEEITLYAEIDVDQVIAAHLKLDPAGHYSRRDILSLNHSKQRLD